MALKLHECLDDYDPLTEDEKTRLESSILERGCRIPVLVWKQTTKDGVIQWLIDGLHRYRICVKHNKYLPTNEFEGTEQEAIALAKTLNDERRHRTPEQRAERIKRITEARKNGESLRTIAKNEKVSDAQVRRDIDVATATGGAVEPTDGKVTGQDGRKRTSKPRKRKPKTQPSENGTVAVPSEADECRPEIIDEEFHPVPDVCLEAFRNRERFKACLILCRQLQKGMDELARLPGGEDLRKQLSAHGAEGKFVLKSEELQSIKRHLKFSAPHSVCPWCVGKGDKSCKTCKGMGWVAKMTWDGAPADVKANLETKK